MYEAVRVELFHTPKAYTKQFESTFSTRRKHVQSSSSPTFPHAESMYKTVRVELFQELKLILLNLRIIEE